MPGVRTARGFAATNNARNDLLFTMSDITRLLQFPLQRDSQREGPSEPQGVGHQLLGLGQGVLFEMRPRVTDIGFNRAVFHRATRPVDQFQGERIGGIEQQDLFARLAVFQGGCDLDAVEAVCTPKDGNPLDVLDRVDSLISQSLLQRRRATNGALRFVMLETIHEFAQELLDGLPDGSVQRRHAEFFAALAETAEPWLTGGRQLEWLARLSREHDNLRAALGAPPRELCGSRRRHPGRRRPHRKREERAHRSHPAHVRSAGR